jgi:hypothetical protein
LLRSLLLQAFELLVQIRSRAAEREGPVIVTGFSGRLGGTTQPSHGFLSIAAGSK